MVSHLLPLLSPRYGQGSEDLDSCRKTKMNFEVFYRVYFGNSCMQEMHSPKHDKLFSGIQHNTAGYHWHSFRPPT